MLSPSGGAARAGKANIKLAKMREKAAKATTGRRLSDRQGIAKDQLADDMWPALLTLIAEVLTSSEAASRDVKVCESREVGEYLTAIPRAIWW
jgi:hypothetical protein